jgi:polar amino acid transport system ATP-binding protein
MAFLNVSNLTKRFDDLQVLKGINFSLEKGQVLSLIGSSGSGKTTLLRCLNFLETPDSGTVSVGDSTVFDAGRKDKPSLREMRVNQLKFGLVFQSFNLFPQHSIRKNLTLAAGLIEKEKLTKAKASRTEIHEAMTAIDRRADEILAQVGLSDKADAYPYQLSGGQCQRAAIARALMLSPDILCFDEPTSALDPELTGEVLRVIRGLRSTDRTMIIVTHEMEFARHVSDRVIFMADGVIAEEGKAEEVINNPKTERLQAFLSKISD